MILTFTFLAYAGSARAQTSPGAGFALDRFDPAASGSDWFVLDSVSWQGDVRPSVGLTFDLAIDPLAIFNADGSVRADVVSDQLVAHLGASLTLKEIVQLSFSVPIALLNEGDHGNLGSYTFDPPDSAALGDIRVGAAVRAVGKPGGPFRLGLGLDFYLPTGSQAQLTGDGRGRVLPHLMLAGDVDNFLYAARVGFLYRAADDTYAGSPLGSELQLAAAAGLAFASHKLVLGPELTLATVVSDSNATFAKTTTPAEALLGGHYTFDSGWRVGAGFGFGLARGFGEPEGRVIASFEWTPPIAAVAVVVVERDRDNDGIPDADDVCPDVPGVKTGDPKTNGCPPPVEKDRDHDRILDKDDACPDVPGVPTSDPKTNGCPPPKPKDSDGDGIPDDKDACPNEAGPADPDPKKNGCPLAHIATDGKQIVILQQVKFAVDKADILPESQAILEAVQKILNDHPEIKTMRIEGHTDDKGLAAYNLGLSDRRAHSVETWLVEHGIAKSRLTAKGYGMTRPIDTNTTDEGRRNNRRVEFHIDSNAN